jgi:hypothetical protein
MIHLSWVPKKQGQHDHTLYPIALLLVVESLLFLSDLYSMVVDLEGWHRVVSQFGVQFHILVADRATPRQGKRPKNPTINQEQHLALLRVNR